MMVYFMRYCKKLSLFLGLFCCLSLAAASSSEIRVHHAELVSSEDDYALQAALDIYVDQAVETAINKSVPLTFLVEFQLVKPRRFWFDQKVIAASKELELSYHALTRQYLLKQDSQQKSFSSFSEALQALAQINHWKVVPKKELEKGASYQATLTMRLDKKKLPKAIQADAIASEDWNIASLPFSWPFKEDQ